MSVSIRFKNPLPSVFPTEKAEANTYATSYRPRSAEPLERGYLAAEAPEGRGGHEAPDAGDCRMSHLEHTFTHGRSQS